MGNINYFMSFFFLYLKQQPFGVLVGDSSTYFIISLICLIERTVITYT